MGILNSRGDFKPTWGFLTHAWKAWASGGGGALGLRGVGGDGVEELLAVAVEFDVADAGEGECLVAGGGFFEGESGEGFIVEDDVGRDVVFPGEFES